MSTVSFGQGTTQLLVYRGAGYVLQLINSVIVVRFLGLERFGSYAYAMGIAALFGLLPNGIGMIVSRTVAGSPEAGAGVVRTALKAQALTSVVLLMAIPLLAAVLPQQPVPLWYIGLAAGNLALSTLSWPYLSAVVGRARYDRLAEAEILIRVVETIILVGAVVLYRSVGAVLVAHLLAAGVTVAVARQAARPFLSNGSDQSLRLKTLFRQALPFSATATIQSLYMRVDILFLGQMVSAASLGLYSAAYKPINMLGVLGGTVATALFPLMVRVPHVGTSTTFQQTMRGLGVAGPAAALVFSGIARPLLTGLYGAEFAAAAPILVLLVWSAAAFWLYAPLGVALQGRGKENLWLLGLTGALTLNIAGNLYAIPHWGAVGAAAATLGSELALVGIGVALTKRALGIVLYKRSIFGILSATAIGGVILLLLLDAGGPFLAVLTALTAYTGVLLFLRIVTIEDATLVMEWLRQAVPGWSKGQI